MLQTKLNLLLNLTLAAILALGLVFNAYAADLRPNHLYRISGNGLSEDSYILGTVHSLLFDYYQDSVIGFRQALQQAKHIMTEKINYVSGDTLKYKEELRIIVKDMLGQADARKRFTVMPTECNYTKLYTPAQLELVKNIFRKYLGNSGAMLLRDNLPLYAWDRFRSSYKHKAVFKTAKRKTMNELCKLDANLVDTKLCHIGKTEKGNTQLDEEDTPGNAMQKRDSLIYTSFSVKEQAYILYRYVKYLNEHPEAIQEDTNDRYSQAYRDQDFELFDQLANDIHHYHSIAFRVEIFPDEISDKLCSVAKAALRFIKEDRTILWIPKIEETIQKYPTLIAMGVNHLIGDEGTLQLLRDKGYTVEPVQY